MEQAAKATVLASDDGEAFWFFGMLVLVKTASQDQQHPVFLSEQRGRRGIATPWHRQPDDFETFHVLEGELRFYLDGLDPALATAGTTVNVPGNAAHAFEVVSETARWLVLTTPQHEAFFRAAGEPAQCRELPPEMPPDMPKVIAAAGQYGVEILGPPPGHEQQN
jgi:quercetin dioxygenase-like cupin family protein